jgi:hypothetical protein
MVYHLRYRIAFALRYHVAFALAAALALAACGKDSSSPLDPSSPESPSPESPAPTTPGDSGSGGSGTDGSGTDGSGDSTSGGADERAQGFLAWTLAVLPSGELQLRFKQTGLSVSSFAYTIGGTLDGDVQCYNKADNAPQGAPFHYSYQASTTVGAMAVDGTVDTTVTTAVMSGLCGNTKFYALPVTTARPFTWGGNFLDNPAGRLSLPEVHLGDAPLSYSSQ